MEKHLRSLVITPEEEVKIKFFKLADQTDEESKQKKHKFSVESMIKPHGDLLDCLKKLRKHAIAIMQMDLNSVVNWEVTGIKLAGDVTEKKSRVQLILTKYVPLTKKSVSFTIPQVTMYPDNEDAVKYADADKMTEIIEDLIEECWSYINGKYAEKGQLALFPDPEMVAA